MLPPLKKPAELAVVHDLMEDLGLDTGQDVLRWIDNAPLVRDALSCLRVYPEYRCWGCTRRPEDYDYYGESERLHTAHARTCKYILTLQILGLTDALQDEINAAWDIARGAMLNELADRARRKHPDWPVPRWNDEYLEEMDDPKPSVVRVSEAARRHNLAGLDPEDLAEALQAITSNEPDKYSSD